MIVTQSTWFVNSSFASRRWNNWIFSKWTPTAVPQVRSTIFTFLDLHFTKHLSWRRLKWILCSLQRNIPKIRRRTYGFHNDANFIMLLLRRVSRFVRKFLECLAEHLKTLLTLGNMKNRANIHCVHPRMQFQRALPLKVRREFAKERGAGVTDKVPQPGSTIFFLF